MSFVIEGVDGPRGKAHQSIICSTLVSIHEGLREGHAPFTSQQHHCSAASWIDLTMQQKTAGRAKVAPSGGYQPESGLGKRAGAHSGWTVPP